MTDLAFRKRLGTLIPTDEESEAALARIPVGSIVMVKIRRPRNVLHHRKLFALLNLVVNNQEHYETTEHLLAAIKVATGHCHTYPMKNGNVTYIPKSISFASMDQTAFDKFWDGAVKFICSKVIPGVDRADLENEILSMVA
ncbi:hypothetical protein LCGC14_1656420 [marine sediment metagenome]|uniref:DUF1367 family protein n=1 Tax=marine sediment metagenome TaxID=412755 RepID=A0A0F9KVE7_9ZZZZ